MSAYNDSLPLHIHIQRHGLTDYRQVKVSLEEANDLTEEGIAQVRAAGIRFAQKIDSSEVVEIWSSPMGRALMTAKVMAEALGEHGKRVHPIEIVDDLEEVRTFNWDFFSPLVTGGSVTVGGETFFIDAHLTNPENLGEVEYFFFDSMHAIPEEVKVTWPAYFRSEIEQCERFASVTKRLLTLLSDIHTTDAPRRLLLITHDGLTSYLTHLFTCGEHFGINRAEMIDIERRNGTLVVTQVADWTEGDCESSIFDAGMYL